MKLIKCFTLSAFMISTGAFAADPVLTVKGKIVPPSCTAELGNGGSLVWADISHSELKANAYNQLEPKEATLNIKCDTKTKTRFALWAKDSSAESAMTGGVVTFDNQQIIGSTDTTRIFGLGFDPRDKKTPVGKYVLVSKSATYEGKASHATHGVTTDKTSDNTMSPINFATRAYSTNEALTVYAASDDENGNKTGKTAIASQFTFTFAVIPQLNYGSLISSTQKVPFKGGLTFYVRYF